MKFTRRLSSELADAKPAAQIFSNCCLVGILESKNAIYNRRGNLHRLQNATLSLKK